MSSSPRPTRRTVLRAGLALAVIAPLAACTSGAAGVSGTNRPSSTPGADDGLRREVARDEQSLVSAYAAALLAHPAQVSIWRVGDRHSSYRTSVLGDLTPSGSPTGATAAPAPQSVPLTVAALTALERQAAARRVSQCGRAQDPELARIIALIGAGCAGAAAVLVRSA